jgi:hypothetical protein
MRASSPVPIRLSLYVFFGSHPPTRITSYLSLQSVALAGEFNALSVVTDGQWDMLESIIRKSNKKG